MRAEESLYFLPRKFHFPHKDGELVSLFLIIDSGATISALPKSDAAVVLGYSVNSGPLFYLEVARKE